MFAGVFLDIFVSVYIYDKQLQLLLLKYIINVQ